MRQSAALTSAADLVTIRLAAAIDARRSSLLALQREPVAAPESALLWLCGAPAR
jgi:CelD/BcsL family acetyltransferase involved in cellulose biosynthesis